VAPLLGLDYGERRIGIAISDPEQTLAFAVGVHVEGRDGSVLALLADLVRERGVVGVVIGLPLTAAGDEERLAGLARRFADRVGEALGLPVTLGDERYSSQEAARAIAARGRPARRGEVDPVAAQIILQQELDRRRAADVPADGS
jgi:putative Holliday junction resolvase